MRTSLIGVGAVGLLIAVSVAGCGGLAARPQAGDTVTPQLAQKLHWTAGRNVTLGIRLHAHNQSSSASRSLDFFSDVDPVANITFFSDDRKLEQVEVSLSHHC